MKNPLDARRMELFEQLTKVEVPSSGLPILHRIYHRAKLKAAQSKNSMIQPQLVVYNRQHVKVRNLWVKRTHMGRRTSSGRHKSKRRRKEDLQEKLRIVKRQWVSRNDENNISQDEIDGGVFMGSPITPSGARLPECSPDEHFPSKNRLSIPYTRCLY